MKVLLAVDGSETSTRATRKLIETLGWYKDVPQLEVINVQLPVPHVGGMHAVISDKDIDRYFADEWKADLGPSTQLLDQAGVQYVVHRRLGQLGETIADQARTSGTDLIYMGTHGRRAASAVVFGSVAMDVLRMSIVPVVLVR
jgi:nucleotide-binding universal stress UspA family protein